MHLTVIILLALAGIGFCLAALQRWRALARAAAADQRDFPWLWSGFASLTIGTLLAVLSDKDHPDLAYGALTVWAGLASLLFLGRWLAMPSRSLLALPIGALALMIATAGATSDMRTPSTEPVPWIVLVHAGFMICHAGAMLVAGAAGGMYLITSWLLKNPTPRALALPNLRLLEHLTERGLITGTALLLGGIATGGAALHQRPISIMNPTTLLGLTTLAFLITILVLRGTKQVNRRSLGIAAVTGLALTAISALSQVVLAHG